MLILISVLAIIFLLLSMLAILLVPVGGFVIVFTVVFALISIPIFHQYLYSCAS